MWQGGGAGGGAASVIINIMMESMHAQEYHMINDNNSYN